MFSALLSRIGWILGGIGILFLIYKTGGFNVGSIDRVSHTIDSRGGNIIILCGFTLLFFGASMGFGYHVLGMIEAKTLTPDNSIAIMLVSWVTGGAFGTSFGALIQQLGGSSSKVSPDGEKKVSEGKKD